MKIIKLLVVSRFQLLIHKGKQVNYLVKNGGEKLLRESSPKQENAINAVWLRLVRPNPYSTGLMAPLLLIPLMWGWATLIYSFNLSIPARAILSLSITPFASVYLVLIYYGLGRGNVSGLLLIRYFYLFDVFLTVVAFFIIATKAISINEWIRQLTSLSIHIIPLCLCRYIMNCNAFSKIVSFSRTTRLILEAKKARESQNKKIK